MKNPRITPVGHCPACKRKLNPETVVVRSDNTIMCAEHSWMIVPGAIEFTGTYREARKS